MLIYAGIDEAGYGPFFGPLTVGCCILRIPRYPLDLGLTGSVPAAPPPLPDLWRRLSKTVARTLSEARGRVVVNDSKKLHTKASGVRHLERSCLAFAAVGGFQPRDLGQWLEQLGETCHLGEGILPWYAPGPDRPWEAMPTCVDPGELAVARGMLGTACQRIGIEVAHLGVAVVLEDRFNRMCQATRSKASVSFTFVAGHLQRIWEQFGPDHPQVVVDRQSGRSHYRALLALNFADAEVNVLCESADVSAYHLHQAAGHGPARSMTVTFQTQAETAHMPVALASMLAKYNRELLMHRFQSWFTQRWPEVAPTAGYGSDAKRFEREITPLLGSAGLSLRDLRRVL